MGNTRNKYSPYLLNNFIRYKANAAKRNLKFDLSESDFSSLWQKYCFYCGTKIKYIGIDRVDNSLGYIKGNIVPCCTTCNMMKRTMNKDDFLNHCQKIVDFSNSKIEGL